MSPIQSWKRIFPCVVSASKSGAVSLMRSDMGPPRGFRWGEKYAALCLSPRGARPGARPAMLIDFFFTLRAAKLKVSVKEYLTLLEAIKSGVIDDPEGGSPTVDSFYYLSRAAAGQGRGAVRQVRPRLRRLLQGRRAARRLHPGDPARVAAEAPRARALARGEGEDREDGLGRADGDAEEALRGAEEAPRGRQQDDRHRRHLALRRLRLQPAGHPHRPGEGPQQERGQGLGPAPVQGLRRQPRARHAQHQGGAATAAPLRPRRRRGGARPRRHDPRRPRPTPAGSTSRWCPSGTTR